MRAHDKKLISDQKIVDWENDNYSFRYQTECNLRF